MKENPVIDCLMNRKSIRKYTALPVPDETVEVVVRAGMQAPFAMQLGSLILSRDRKLNPFGAPLCFTVCVDLHRMERVMERRGWKRKASDSYALLFGMQDACYIAQNMVIAGEASGLGSCYIGGAPYMAAKLRERFSLPEKVFPMVMLVMGFPDENPPVRPRYPLSFHLFEERYPELTDPMVDRAMERMDRGYLEQEYYRRANYMIPLPEGMEERFSFENYGWTEHISRKMGLWGGDPEELPRILRECGFGGRGQS